ncbi:MAG TPA: DUF4142 domain-containing protein [Bryobacteraceae bacterium]|nr:DUF4142 domain-containing protein [Bryobacteraceae bacterium]
MKTGTVLVTGITVFGMLAFSALAQQTRGTAQRLAGSDDTFMNKAAQGGMAEVELGQLAQQRASNSAVKEFGTRMVNDHTTVNNELKSIAAKENVTLPTSLDAKDQATYDRLSKLSGADFDRAYMSDMVKDHTADISEFKKEASSGNDPQVKAFASKALPTLESHLKQAKSVNDKVK